LNLSAVDVRPALIGRVFAHPPTQDQRCHDLELSLMIMRFPWSWQR
jgi:hypothetical protein